MPFASDRSARLHPGRPSRRRQDPLDRRGHPERKESELASGRNAVHRDARKMTLDELDRLLITWKARTDSAAAGLVELRSLPSYEILTGGHDGHKVQLSGTSEQRVTPALASLEQAWRDYGVISTAYSRALSLRRQMPRF